MIEIELKDNLSPGLARLIAGLRSVQPLMRMLAGSLADVTEANFAAQGRPRWLGLKYPRRKKNAEAKILQESGHLAASVTADSDATSAWVGSNLPYAAIHQMGGTTRAHVILPRNKKALAFGGRVVKRVNHPGSKIPARPYLPFTPDGRLQPEAVTAIEADVQTWLRSLVG